MKTLVIIPSRLSATRLPGKPLLKINGLSIISHVFKRAEKANIGEVIVAAEDKEIVEDVKINGGNAILTKNNHQSGSDRVYEAYSKKLGNKVDLIINLQGDMPNIKPESISKLANHMKSNNCDIGTLASIIKDKREFLDKNIVKFYIDQVLEKNNFLKAKDFFRINNDLNSDKIYHHIGIYAFTSVALTKYVKLPRSKLEIERNLEQMRAMENNLIVKVGLSESLPLGVDTKEDLAKVTNEMDEV